MSISTSIMRHYNVVCKINFLRPSSDEQNGNKIYEFRATTSCSYRLKVKWRQTLVFLSVRNTHVCLTFVLVLQLVYLFSIFTIDRNQSCKILEPKIHSFFDILFFLITNKITKTYHSFGRTNEKTPFLHT